MNFYSTYLLPIILFIIMIGIGMSAKLKDFKTLVKNPKAGLIGITSQVILLPCLGFALGLALNLSHIQMVGVLLITLCPSGSGSNIISKMVGGDLALSVSLTTISSILSLIMLPLVLNYYMDVNNNAFTNIHLPVLDSLIQIFLTSVLPVSIGLFISEKKSSIAEFVKPTLKWLLPGMLFVVFCLIFLFESGKNNIEQMVYFFIVAFILNIVSMLFAFGVSKLFRVNEKHSLSISIEGGLKNSAIGLFIALNILNSEVIANILIAYGMVSFYTTFLLSFGIKKLTIKQA